MTCGEVVSHVPLHTLISLLPCGPNPEHCKPSILTGAGLLPQEFCPHNPAGCKFLKVCTNGSDDPASSLLQAGGLEDEDPKAESGFSPKIMQKHLKTR